MSISRFQILSLDGGGFRGLFQAWCLAEWEKLTGRKTSDCFDLIAGTSTGGILALALSLGVPAKNLVDFYIQDGRRIFPKNRAWRAWHALRRVVLPKLNSRHLKTALIHRIGESKRLGDAKTRLLIPSFDLSVRKTWLFKTDHHEKYKSDWKRSAWEVAMATSAAPTYFRPFHSSWGTAYVDGGIWANNPTHLAVVEATEILGCSREAVHILNLGNSSSCCGNGQFRFKHRLGIVGWAAEAPELILDASALAVAGEMQRTHGERYIRVAPGATAEPLPLDRYVPDWLTPLAVEQARFNASVAEVFFSHTAPAYAKCRRSTTALAQTGGVA